ncbi:HET-domain-containing protein [Trametes versicolor FP-101664 SS1]|uniref:HET-domain-containing protein n=1 Tax=Trametes versicolor (strain FP-101664) TaxID=717944 RepID=UPI0004622C6D|nr:HET-domain-containing protein [Trametes versicolor FP-101664 SS1]EIW61724.1 HET-domain-containing protein [Trametes versicolor FP-101664 SS1]
MTLELRYFNDVKEVNGRYAILSHVWEQPEQSFQEIRQLQYEGASLHDPRICDKILGAINAARLLGFYWIWIDTCCIDKTSSAGLEEAINSMFRWYAQAGVCIAYLADVPSDCTVDEPRSAFRWSNWFRRGWTLQELIAPQVLVFMSSDWTPLGTKAALCYLLEEITSIDAAILTFRRPLQQVSVANRMSWTSGRTTSRVEDEAYSLMGIFDITMSTIYGEGREAFRRLQEEIMKRNPDHTLFAWGRVMLGTETPMTPLVHRRNSTSSLFAPSPSAFWHSACLASISLGAVAELVREQFTINGVDHQTVCEHRVTSYGIRCDFIIVEGNPFTLALLPCKSQAGECVALILWRRAHPTSGLSQFSVGVTSHEVSDPPGYRLLFIGPSTIELLRRIGWAPMTNSLEQPSAFSTPRHSGNSMSEGLSRASTAIAYGSLTTVYIADVQAPSELNVFAHLSATEPDAFFIPSWLKPTLAAHFGFDMESKETWSSGRARPPKSYRFIHRSTRERFVLHLGRCNDSLLCAHVSIRPASPQDRTRDYADGVPYNPSSISPLPTPCPNYDPTFSTVYHVNSWPNGSLSFGNSRRTVTLTATRWPHDHSYCLEVRLGGRVYADLRQRQRSRPSSDLQAQLEHSG